MKNYYVTCSYKLSESDFWKSGVFDLDTRDVFNERGFKISTFDFHKGIGMIPKEQFMVK